MILPARPGLFDVRSNTVSISFADWWASRIYFSLFFIFLLDSQSQQHIGSPPSHNLHCFGAFYFSLGQTCSALTLNVRWHSKNPAIECTGQQKPNTHTRYWQKRKRDTHTGKKRTNRIMSRWIVKLQLCSITGSEASSWQWNLST